MTRTFLLDLIFYKSKPNPLPEAGNNPYGYDNNSVERDNCDCRLSFYSGNLQAGTWTEESPMPTAVSSSGAALVNGVRSR